MYVLRIPVLNLAAPRARLVDCPVYVCCKVNKTFELIIYKSRVLSLLVCPIWDSALTLQTQTSSETGVPKGWLCLVFRVTY